MIQRADKLLRNSKAVTQVFLGLCLSFKATFSNAEERTPESWFRLKKGFRSGHNFSSQLESESGTWSFRRNIMRDSFTAGDRRQGIVFNYGFHILSYGKVGFEMGTGFGRFVTARQSQAETIELPLSSRLPSLRAGGVWNLDINHRLRGVGELGLERYDNVRFKADQGMLPTSFTMDFVASSLQYDYFFSNSWCLTLGFAYKRSEFNAPKNITEGLKTFLDSSFSYRSKAIQIGFGYYLI